MTFHFFKWTFQNLMCILYLQLISVWMPNFGRLRWNIVLLLLLSRSVVSDSVRPHRWQPARLPHPWDSPGKNTGVGCHFLLQCMKLKSESEVAQSCPTLSDPMDCSAPGSSVHGVFQARVLEWGAITGYWKFWLSGCLLGLRALTQNSNFSTSRVLS